jgi:hypothetical protein
MNKVLKNDIALVQIKKSGAEVVSFKKIENDCEYMWNGDKKYCQIMHRHYFQLCVQLIMAK